MRDSESSAQPADLRGRAQPLETGTVHVAGPDRAQAQVEAAAGERALAARPAPTAQI